MNWCEPKAGRRWFHFATLTRVDTLAILDDAVRVEQRSLATLKLEQLKTKTGQIVTRGLFFPLAQYFSRFQIDQMHGGASDALERLIGVIIVGHLIGGPSLNVLAGAGATIEKRPRHRKKIAQTKREN
jgi:hypothetical protein